MADTDGNTPDPLIDELVRRPWAFDFYRAIRLLESQRTDLPRVGFSISPTEDPLRFWQNPSFRFAPAPLDTVRAQGTGGVPRIAVNFFGLFGPNAPMPPHITEYVLEREIHHHDPTITAFFNIFHHRLLSLFYRAWAANQKALDLDRPRDQRYAVYIGALFGIGMDALQDRDAVPDPAKLFFSGRLSSQTRNVEGLESILREYFHIPAEVQPFAGRWLTLPADSVCRLGESEDSGSMGINTIVGARFWDSQLSFRMRFGPMSLADYERMLPKGDSFERLKGWVHNYCGEHFFWDAQLVLRADEVPPTRLGQTGTGSLSADDLSDLPSLAGKLSAESRPGSLSRFLRDQLSPVAKEKLRTGSARGSLRDRQVIADELNRVIQRSPLYDEARFAGVALSEETRKLLTQARDASNVTDLNRRLLADAFPLEISKDRRTGSGSLSADDLTDLPSLAAKLSAESEPGSLSRHLWDQLLPMTRDKLRNCTADMPLPDKQAIVNDLNRVIQGSPLYDENRFAGVALSAETRKLLAQPPDTSNMAGLNRKLLEDAYPLAISKHRRAESKSLSTDDITDLPSLAAKLSAESQPESVARHLWDQLSPAIRDRLRNCTANTPLQDKQAIVDELNRVLQRSPLYDAKRFAGVTLSAETRELLERARDGSNMAVLNRRLLEDAFPLEISKHRRPGGLGWTTWLKTKSFSHDADQLILSPPPD